MPDPTDAATPAGPVLVEPPSAAELVAGATGTWRAALVEAAGGSTLADVELLGDAALDLSAAHPSGIAQLFAGRETRLSNLVREGAALGTARRRARAVAARAGTYAQQYGIAPTYLAIGVASWTEHSTPDVATDDVAAIATATRESAAARPDGDGEEAPAPAARKVRAPVLLRPVSLRARGTAESDYELTLEPSLEVNPVLARALRSRGALLDPGAVARSAFTGSGFDPRDAITRLTSLGTAVLDDFQLVDRIVVGTFVHPGQVLVDDLDRLASSLERHEVVAALAGVAEAAAGLDVALPEPARGDRDPALERGVGDLDPAQQHVLDVVAGGAHVFVDAPADSDVTGTLAALVADAAAEGRTVLYVPGHRRAAVALRERLERLGVGEILLDVAPDAAWRAASSRRLMGAMTLDVDPGDPAATAELRRALVDRRERLRGYVDGLHLVREPWGASAYDAFQALARLTARRPAPRTTVRLTAEVARSLDAGRRAAVGAELQEAAEAGAFTLRPVDTPWYGAALLTDDEAADALRRAERLAGEDGLPAVERRIAEVAEVTGFTPATTLATWAEQLEVLAGVRGALDVFQPIVFERSPADMVAATASKAWRAEHDVPMGYWLRRRLKKQAKDLVRPGRPVADLHAALLDVQRQRAIWAEHCPAGGWPRLPEGLGEIEAEHRAVRADVEALAVVLAGTPEGADLLGRPIGEVLERVRRLVAARDTLAQLPERTRLLRSLRAAGLDDLLDDLAARRVPAGVVAAELELAWWSTVFEQVLAADPALAGYDGRTLGRLAAEYRELDVAHTAALAGPVRARAAAHVRNTMAAHTEQTEALFAELVEERLTGLRETFERYPDVARRLRPVLAAAPMLVPQVLPAARTVDLVVLDAAAHLPVEVALPAIARGRQVVVVGDRRCASGTAIRELADVLPTVPLRADASRRDPYLTAFLAAHGYGDVLSPTPLPTSAAAVGHHLVDGTGMPDGSGAVQSTRADVDRVVELVIEHALTHGEESLAVVTASPVHTAQIREAVLAQVRDSPSLAACLDGARPEPFVVTDLTNVAGLRRDALILSLGFGRTPHGRVLHRFGPISGPGGDALLLAALGVTRHRLDVVSCFPVADVDPERLRGPGPRLLADLLRFAERRAAGETDLAIAAAPDEQEAGPDGASADTASADTAAAVAGDAPGGAAPPVGEEVKAPAVAEEVGAPAAERAPDRLVVDLAERLWRHGLVVELDHGLPGGLHLPLAVGHPDLPGELLVAVLTDDDAYLHEPSVRVRDRQVAERLERLGWSVLRVWSAAAFLDPEAEVDRIRRALHAVADRRIAESEAERARARLIVPAPLLDDDGTGPAPTLTGFAVIPGADLPAGGGARPGERRVLDATGAITVVPDDSAAAVDGAAPGAAGASGGPGGPGGREGASWTPPAAPGEPTADAPGRRGAGASGSGAADSGSGSGAAGSGAGAAARGAGAPAPAAGARAAGQTAVGEARTPERPAAAPSSAAPATAAQIPGVMEAAAPMTGAVRAVQPTLAVPGGPRPDVRPGLPISAYSDDQLDDLVAWLVSDGTERTPDELAAALRAELGITRRGARVDSVVSSAVARATR
ncbi:hypothetical protein MHY85_20095 [Cellulomonas sp. ACRRI]|nr:hypothetical protein [Cellulomonas sp. ACRRI]MCG7288259.1 hypothetical protein [Cellulomonas sp. ACRRI]